MYKVIRFFTDLQDGEHPYNVGDTFPRSGLSVSEQRLQELSGRNNLQQKQLIKMVDDEPASRTEENAPAEPKSEIQYSRTDILRMNKAGLLEAANGAGIAGADEMTGEQLKERLLSMFNL